MIDEDRNMQLFGYVSSELKPKSHKRIIVICEKCGKYRNIMKQKYRDLCPSCSRVGKITPTKTKIKQSKSHSGRIKSPEHCKNISKSKLGVYDGENNPNWQGGLSFGKYCSKFNNQLKQLIRDRYNNCDYMSDIHKNICNNGRALDVHHVDYNKQQGCDDHEWRLIPLSKSNHMRTNANRPFWNKLFIYSLEIDRWYYILNISIPDPVLLNPHNA